MAEAEATYDAKARKCLADWVGPTYEDVVDVVGEVRMANVGQGAFSLLIAETGALVPGDSFRLKRIWCWKHCAIIVKRACA